jgi:hypothetical protein
MYLIAKEIFGDPKKGQPGFRRFLQQTGQFGRGIVNESYPLSIERASFNRLVVEIGQNLPDYKTDQWRNYGKDKSFWAEILLEKYRREGDDKDIIVNDLRFECDKTLFQWNGFEVYLVLCTEETRKERLAKEGEVWIGMDPDSVITGLYSSWNNARSVEFINEEHLRGDISEEMCTQISNQFIYTKYIEKKIEFPTDHVIWNDHREPPASSILREDKSYLTPEEFNKKFLIQGVTEE